MGLYKNLAATAASQVMQRQEKYSYCIILAAMTALWQAHCHKRKYGDTGDCIGKA